MLLLVAVVFLFMWRRGDRKALALLAQNQRSYIRTGDCAAMISESFAEYHETQMAVQRPPVAVNEPPVITTTPVVDSDDESSSSEEEDQDGELSLDSDDEDEDEDETYDEYNTFDASRESQTNQTKEDNVSV